MIQTVYPQINLLEIALPGNPLKAINTYLICGEKRNLIIDTGFNIPEGKKSLMTAMNALGMTAENTDLLITHLHSDHSGLGAALAKEGFHVFASVVDGNLINDMTSDSYWEKFASLNVLMGLHTDHIAISEHPGYKYCPKEPVAFTYLREGDRLDLGDFDLRVIDVPGHTPGHIVLYDEEKQLLFSGDHILDRISPNISFWGFEQDILDTYLASLEKVRNLPVDYCFTAHRNLLRDHTRRIDQLKQHHHDRLKQIESILVQGECDVRFVASRMQWDLKAPSWEDFPPNQKWFAAGEALSHLEHLFYTGRAGRRIENGRLLYTLLLT